MAIGKTVRVANPDSDRRPAPGHAPEGAGIVVQMPVELDEKEETPADARSAAPRPEHVLVIDVGGTKIKVLATGQTEPRHFESGKRMTPAKMVDEIAQLAEDWTYEAISIGFPGLIGDHGPASEPLNL